MPHARVLSMADSAAVESFARSFAEDHPSLHFGRFTLRDEATTLRPDHGGMKIFWIYEGEGGVFLPAGFRTKEGDGASLPSEYQAEPIPIDLAETLAVIQGGRTTVVEAARVPVDAMLSRWQDGSYVGDCANDLWKLEHLPAPWSSDSDVENSLRGLFAHCMDVGYSQKRIDSWERIMEGDQLIVVPGVELQVRGSFSCLTLENAERMTSHVPAVMRLRYLKDTAGGCNFDFEPFRRLPLTWYLRAPDDAEDGLNFVNSHVVNIAKETSPSHFHPPFGLEGSSPQNEFYLVLDPAAYGLDTHGRQASLITYPDLRNLKRYEEHPLKPGDFVHIPPGTGHRGMDVFVNVLTVPGFKPHNEYYIDGDIEAAGGGAPFNPDLINLKNYGNIEDLLGTRTGSMP